MAENTDQNLSDTWRGLAGAEGCTGDPGLVDEAIRELEATIVKQRRIMHRHDMWVSRRHEQLNSLTEMFRERVEDVP